MAKMNLNNIIVPFTICGDTVKGRMVKLDDHLNVILNQHKYPDLIAKILGELLMVAAIIGSQFKDSVILTVQLQTEGKIKYIVADYQSPGQIRGYAQFDKEEDYSQESYQNIIGNAFITVTIDRPLYNNQRYQGIIETNNMTISAAMEKYFYQSEQINTLLKLAVGKIIIPGKKETWCGGGIMIQKLPDDDSEDLWIDAQAYFLTIRDDELFDPTLSLEKFLYSVYHEVDIKIYDYLPIVNQCRCSREKAEQAILSIGLEDAMSLLINEKISVDCQFCNKSQDFFLADLKKLFKGNHEAS